MKRNIQISIWVLLACITITFFAKIPTVSALDPENVTITLKYSISPSDDIIIDDQFNPSEGLYTRSELSYPYFASQTSEALVGLIPYPLNQFLTLTYKETEGDDYIASMTQKYNRNTFLIPFTKGSYLDISQRYHYINNNNFLRYPDPNFAYGMSKEKDIRIELFYENILLTGISGNVAPGYHTLVVSNLGIKNGKTNIKIERK